MTLLGLSPALFWSALISATLAAVALHFLRVRSPKVVVPTLLFWDQAIKERAPRMIWRKLARLGSLLLVLAILWLLSVAAADPGVDPARARHEVVLLDPAALHFPIGRQEAVLRLKELADHTRRAFVLATVPCRVLCGFEEPKEAAARLVEEEEKDPCFAQADWRRALESAAALLAGRGETRVRIFCLDPRGLPEDGEDICGTEIIKEYLPAPLWDDGVTAASPVFLADGGAAVLVEARRRGRGRGERLLQVSFADGTLLEEATVRDGKGAHIFIRNLQPGSRLVARLTGQDPLPENDSLTITVPLRGKLPLYVPRKGPVLTALLDSMERIRVVSEASSARLALTFGGEGEKQALDLPRLVFYGPKAGTERAPLQVVSDHPLVEGLTFQGVRAPVDATLPKIAIDRILAKVGDKPAILLAGEEPVSLHIGMDPEKRESGFAEHSDFPRLISRALHALAGEPDSGGGLKRGMWFSLTGGLNSPSLSLQADFGSAVQVPLSDGRGEGLTPTTTRLDLAGRVALKLPGAGPPLARPPGEDEKIFETDADSAPLPLTSWLIIFALSLLLFEGWAYHRGRVA